MRTRIARAEGCQEGRNRAVAVGRGARRVHSHGRALCNILASISLPAWPQQNSADLTEQSLEDLMNIEVTSVSKDGGDTFAHGRGRFCHFAGRHPPLGRDEYSGPASAWFRAWTLRRSTAIRGPSARADSMTDSATTCWCWLTAAPVYTQTFGGVYWDTLDLPLEDIEQNRSNSRPGRLDLGSECRQRRHQYHYQESGAKLTAGWWLPAAETSDKDLEPRNMAATAGRTSSYRVYAKYLNQGHFA